MMRKFLLIGVGVGVLVAGCGSASVSSPQASPTTSVKASTAKTSKPAAPTVAKVGQWVTAGAFVYKVNAVHYVKSLPDAAYGAPSAHGGEWLELNVSVKNNASKARTMDSSLFTLYKGKTSYNASDAADMFINGSGGSFFLSSVNPGLTDTGTIAFDVPGPSAYVLRVMSGPLGTTRQEIAIPKP